MSAKSISGKLNFDENGLVPVVMQDADTGDVLTLAYANLEPSRRPCPQARLISTRAPGRNSGTRVRRAGIRRA